MGDDDDNVLDGDGDGDGDGDDDEDDNVSDYVNVNAVQLKPWLDPAALASALRWI